jgi:signal transduction histidine kinase
LRLEVEELRASRARLAAAADAERRKLERDLHDGTQQHLVALAVNLQHARQLAESNPAGLEPLLAEIGRSVREALESVRELANAIYPPLLLDLGLAEALRAAASASGIPTRVEVAALEPYAPEVEGAVYFCCLAALRHAASHAGSGAHATVRVWGEPNTLLFEVVGDDASFDQRAPLNGAGLTEVRDRVGAVGGRLTISAEPGHGTRISATIPLTS